MAVFVDGGEMLALQDFAGRDFDIVFHEMRSARVFFVALERRSIVKSDRHPEIEVAVRFRIRQRHLAATPGPWSSRTAPPPPTRRWPRSSPAWPPETARTVRRAELVDAHTVKLADKDKTVRVWKLADGAR